jgi:glycolate oxidase iron-sulfur subunit
MSAKSNNLKSPEVLQCSKCGACLPVCPVYLQKMEEGASPRAKIQLAKHYTEKNLPTSSHLSTLINRCLMCGNCTAACPSGVEHQSLFMRMRSYMATDHGEGWHLKVLYHFLSHEQQLRLASRFAKLGRNHMLNYLASEFKVGNIPAKRLPKFNKRPFREQIAEKVGPDTPSRGTVLYFTGCGTNYIFDRVGHSLCRILKAMGFQVETPKSQVCCGLPLFIHGNLEKAAANIKTNIKLFNRNDIVAVVTDCATCGSALHKEYGIVLKELGLATGAAEELGSKVRDISEFILDNYALLEPHLDPKVTRQKVTYHMPCHLRNGQGITTEVETLLKRLPHVDYTRADDYNQCCGGGGTFFYDHPETSHQIVSKKIKNARATEADLWVTGCPGCSINLSGNLQEEDTISVEHILLLIEQALKK